MPQYQGVWTLEAQAQAQSNQQWVTDPNFKNTTLLLQADGTGSGSQNNTFLDSSTNNFFITRNGNTTQGSFSPFSQPSGYWSNSLSASNNLSFPSNAGYQFDSGNFTVEVWIYFNTVGNAQFASIPVAGALYWQYFSGALDFGNNAGGSVQAAWSPVANTWYHLAAVRNGGTFTNYINGAVHSSGSAFNVTATGAIQLGYGGAGSFNGYMTNFRIVKGTAVYTAAFTPPPNPLTNITNTSLLTCQSNRFVDNSSSSLTPTVNGSPSIQLFAPFAPALQWTPDVVGGSGYFDGTSDWLQTPSSANLAMSTGDFTIECWVNTSLTGARYIFDIRPSGSQAIGAYISSSNLYVNSGSTLDILASSAFVLNAWNHFAYVRSGSGSNNVSIFLNGVRVYQRTDATDYSSNAIVYVGADNAGAYSNGGYISGFRILKGTAQYSGATITVPTAPPTAITNTQLLLNSTNAGIYDGKMGNVLETVGNAQVSTNPVKYGSGSMKFDGTGDWLLIPNNQMLNLNADFTIEFWIYLNSTSGEQSIFHNHNSDNNGIIVSVNGGAAGKIRLGAGNGSSFYVLLDSSTAISTSTWNHVACTRNINTWTIYINGSNAGSTTNASNPTFSTSDSIQIGRFTSGTPNALNAYLDDFRITKACRYFANFTPPQQALPRQ